MAPDADTGSIHVCMCVTPNKQYLALIPRSGVTSHEDV